MISMSKRQRIGNRYISRRKDGTFSKNVNVGRSLSADRRNNAKKTVKAGYGDKGDIKRAGESCPKCDGVANDDTTMMDTYYLCGNCDIAWYDGGRDNPITMREFQWIQKNPIQHYGVSREEVEELYGKDSHYINYEAESFGADSTWRVNTCTHRYEDTEEEAFSDYSAWKLRDSEVCMGDGSSGYVETGVRCDICGQERIGSWAIENENEGFQITKGEEGRMPRSYGWTSVNELFGADVVQDVKDFDVVGTAQDVVGKTGLKIPTGVASLAVVWIAYMTGKRYGN